MGRPAFPGRRPILTPIVPILCPQLETFRAAISGAPAKPGHSPDSQRRGPDSPDSPDIPPKAAGANRTSYLLIQSKRVRSFKKVKKMHFV